MSGGAGGIGLEIARTLAREGAAVVVTSRRAETLDQAEEAMLEVTRERDMRFVLSGPDGEYGANTFEFPPNGYADLNLRNLAEFLRIPGILEVSIGHALISDALELGYAAAVKAYLASIDRAFE